MARMHLCIHEIDTFKYIPHGCQVTWCFQLFNLPSHITNANIRRIFTQRVTRLTLLKMTLVILKPWARITFLSLFILSCSASTSKIPGYYLPQGHCCIWMAMCKFQIFLDFFQLHYDFLQFIGCWYKEEYKKLSWKIAMDNFISETF